MFLTLMSQAKAVKSPMLRFSAKFAAQPTSPRLGIKKGDTVSVYMPITWHIVAIFLAWAGSLRRLRWFLLRVAS